MKKKINIVGVVKISVVILVLLTLLVPSAWQLYNMKSEEPQDDRLVLGLEETTGEFEGAGLSAEPVPMGDLVAVVSGSRYMVVNSSAKNHTEDSFILSDPVMAGKGSYCVAGDYGATKARLYEKGELMTEIETNGGIISMAVNTSGTFAVATAETGYDATITVYKRNGTPIYRYHIGENSFVDMDIAPNNRLLLITETLYKDGDTGSRVTLTDFTKDDSVTRFEVSVNLYLDVHFNKSGTFVCMGSESVDIYRTDGTRTAQIDYAGRTLSAADISTDNMICLGFGGEITSRVEIYDKNGSLRGTAEFSGEPEHICVNGSHASVAHGNTVDIINSDGTIKKSFEAASQVKYAAPFANGRETLIFAGGSTEILRG